MSLLVITVITWFKQTAACLDGGSTTAILCWLSLLLIVSVTPNLLAVESRWQPWLRWGQLMMTRDDLCPLINTAAVQASNLSTSGAEACRWTDLTFTISLFLCLLPHRYTQWLTFSWFILSTNILYKFWRGVEFPPPTVLDLSTRRTSALVCCLCHDPCSDFHPLHTWLKYILCGEQNIQLCLLGCLYLTWSLGFQG